MLNQAPDDAYELHAAMEEFLVSLNAELVATIKQRDAVDAQRIRLTMRAMEIEARIAEVAQLEKRVRRMP